MKQKLRIAFPIICGAGFAAVGYYVFDGSIWMSALGFAAGWGGGASLVSRTP